MEYFQGLLLMYMTLLLLPLMSIPHTKPLMQILNAKHVSSQSEQYETILFLPVDWEQIENLFAAFVYHLSARIDALTCQPKYLGIILREQDFHQEMC